MNNPSTTNAPLADYLAHLPLSAQEREQLAQAGSFSELHQQLAGDIQGEDAALASVGARLRHGYGQDLDDAQMLGMDDNGRTYLKAAPPIQRTKVIPEPWRTNPIMVRGWRRLTGRSNPAKPARDLPKARWQRVGSLRRFILLLLMLGADLRRHLLHERHPALPGLGLRRPGGDEPPEPGWRPCSRCCPTSSSSAS